MSDLVMPIDGAKDVPHAPGRATPQPRAPRRSHGLRALLILALLGAAGLAAVLLIAQDVPQWSAPVHVQIDGDEVFSGFSGHELPPAQRVVLATAVLMASLAALLIVPLAVLLGLLALLAAVLLAVGLPLLVLLAALSLLMSPLLLLGWLVWKLAT